MKSKPYDKKQIDWGNILFDNKALFRLILPIAIEQFLNSFMGMIVSVASMCGCRVMLCNFLVKAFGFGLIAVWIGMFADWTIRAVIFSIRFMSGRWIHHFTIKHSPLKPP